MIRFFCLIATGIPAPDGRAGRNGPCPKCGKTVHRSGIVCPHCGRADWGRLVFNLMLGLILFALGFLQLAFHIIGLVFHISGKAAFELMLHAGVVPAEIVTDLGCFVCLRTGLRGVASWWKFKNVPRE